MADAFKCILGLLFITLISDRFLLPVTKAELHPASDFSRHTLVKLKIYHGREKRQISTTKEEDGRNTHDLHISYNIDGKDYLLHLHLNRNLIPKGYFLRYQKNGRHVVNRPNEEDVDLCHYHGKIKGIPDSWAAISTCGDNGISGMVFDGKELHYLEKPIIDRNTKYSDLHFLYKHSDLVTNHNKTCGYKNHNHNVIENSLNNRILRYKRSVDSSSLKGPYNANRQSRYVELILVVDNAEFKEMGENHQRVEHHCQQIANLINALYAPLNIFIALVGIVIWSEHDHLNFSSNGDTTLTNFLHYRKEILMKEHPNDNAQLLTKFSFEHGVVGKALKGPICTIEYSGGVNTDHSPVLGLVATTVAHEMGHNFGMEHDTNECVCPEERCIMAPSSSSTPPAHWSSCSLEYLALAFEHGMDYCLRNKPEALFASPVCGNGFVEPGEQCDCGLPEHCDNTCCNATTCMLYSNATCATGECCYLKTCRPKSASTLCRSADYECDLPEYCTGQSEYCPPDIYKMDTETCDGGKAFCYQGFCRTRSDQCKLLWGETGKSSDDQCYLLNTRGSRHGNCGYNKLNQSFYKCRDEDVFCGMLHCKHLNERLEFGMESVAILSHSFINVKGSVVPCRTALVDLGINQIDPGLAPDGAKCGESKMCVNQKCMSVENLRAQGRTCPNNCNGNGICNSLGHCHCKDGFAPPFCDLPGFGGSEDSGPTSDPEARRDFVTALFIIFLGILPALAIIGFLMYYTRHNLKFSWKKASPTKSSPSKPRGIGPFQPSSQIPKRSEDIHSLLQEEAAPIAFKKEFFGNFKGFSISPLKAHEQEPIRPAPPIPEPVKSPNLTRSNTTNVSNIARSIVKPESDPIPPALPPLNPGAHPRPIISSPILENSTCTAKELMSPLKNAPKVPIRPAPVRPLSSPDSIMISTIIPEEKSTKENSTALSRITSFLKADKKFTQNTNTLPKNPKVKAPKILDKNSLRTIEISNPIPQSDISIPTAAKDVNVDNRPVVMRAQSMRGGNVTPRPNIPNFGSMRNPSGVKRPVSIPTANRPKSPPPPRPLHETKPGSIKVPSLPGYKPPGSIKIQNQYDDCLNEAKLVEIKEEKESSPISDNIYAVIDETPNTICSPEIPAPANDGAGLLGEIVSEIQNRNGDSIYSTSTLARRKKEESLQKENEANMSEIYVNTSSMYKVPESIYSNMNQIKSSASSTSSGYINPSSVNPPIKPIDVSEVSKSSVLSSFNVAKPCLSTFKSDVKPEVSAQKPLPSAKTTAFKNNRNSFGKDFSKPNNKATPSSPTAKTAKPLNRQTTPPNLRTRKPSPTRTPSSPTTTASNSPDLVMSCSSNENSAKSPDVLNSAPNILKKPNLPKSVPKVNKPVSFKNSNDKKLVNNSDIKPNVSTKIIKATSDAGSKSVTSGARIPNRQNSNVAALQQKFENKPPISSKSASLKK
ncbi:hypothetical protein RN001_011480 [Aquatica leii]|uniref:Disintegrin and metalloproteinase domain-containing protein 12 n=1 Tax=Aquatica leii TaxID=1421715 RepID=A0AAN7QDW2_9COLE|nr:hypothetical protein RN001_011480 [Aquatica leii]